MKLTDKAADRVKAVMAENELNPAETNLRLGVSGGGCSGINFSMAFEETSKANPLMDTVITQGDVRAVIERRFEGLFNEVTVDFVESEGRSGFAFQRAGGSGCGGCSGEGCGR